MFLNNFFHPEYEYSFPKYDSYVEEDGTLKIDVALAGYSKDDLEVYYENHRLLIRTAADYINTSESAIAARKYITNNLAKRKFKLMFNILRPYEIESCKLENGLLSIEMRLQEKVLENSRVKIK